MDSKKEGSYIHWFGIRQNQDESNASNDKEKDRRNNKPEKQIKTL